MRWLFFNCLQGSDILSVRFKMKLAGLVIDVCAEYDYVRNNSEKYLCIADDADFCVCSTDAKINPDLLDIDNPPADYVDSICLLQAIADKLPMHNAVLCHGAAISYNGGGYLFMAPSGVGKSTHIRLWRQHFGESVDIINGDKPIIRLTDNGFYVCSTPWAGKENWNKNVSFPLKAICFIDRANGDKPTCKSVSGCEERLLRQIYLPREQSCAIKTLELADAICAQVPLYNLRADISEDSVKAAFECLIENR